MELKLELGYEKISKLAKRLPPVQQVQLKQDIEQIVPKTSLTHSLF